MAPLSVAARAAAPVLVTLVAAFAVACARAPGEPSQAGAAFRPSPVSSVFARESFPTPRGDADAGPAEPAVPTTADPAALDEILAAASARAGAAAPADPSDLLGTETGVPEDAGAEHAPASAARSGRVSVGKPVFEPGVSSLGVERAARAQLYWPLVQRCRDEAGAILPPEVVHLHFRLDIDGHIVLSSIHVSSKDLRYAAAARCMERELAAATFRAPPAGRGNARDVDMDVPSVD